MAAKSCVQSREPWNFGAGRFNCRSQQTPRWDTNSMRRIWGKCAILFAKICLVRHSFGFQRETMYYLTKRAAKQAMSVSCKYVTPILPNKGDNISQVCWCDYTNGALIRSNERVRPAGGVLNLAVQNRGSLPPPEPQANMAGSIKPKDGLTLLVMFLLRHKVDTRLLVWYSHFMHCRSLR